MSLPILSVEQMRGWEQATWATGQSEQNVIARVGKLVAQRALSLTQSHDLVLILAGKGHNGDDARATLPHLAGRETLLLEVTEPEIALEILLEILRAQTRPRLAIDGLFGTGLSRALSDSWQKLIRAVNESRIPVLSIDVPSGIDADAGEVRGAAIVATATLTLAAPKRGLLAASAIPFVGKLEVAPEIGLVPCPFASETLWTIAEDFQNFPPARNVASHKGTFGHVCIVAGSLGFHGAAVLAARGALRAQPGLVSVFTPENVYTPVASQLQAAMVHPWKTSSAFPDSCSAILLGPGLAADELPANMKREFMEIWTESPLPVTVDASALAWLPAGGNFEKQLRVITPHPGEAARMLSLSNDAIQSDRVSALRKLSARHGNCFVVLKGHQTLVGKSFGEIFVNSSGNPFLAQGGSGDVLAGFISGLLAQPALQHEPLKTIRYAVWQHGAAADRLCEKKPNWTIADLLDCAW